MAFRAGAPAIRRALSRMLARRRTKREAGRATHAETRWGCFLPDLTRLASGTSAANLPRPISPLQVAGASLRRRGDLVVAAAAEFYEAEAVAERVRHEGEVAPGGGLHRRLKL